MNYSFNIKTCYSLLSSLIRIDDLIEFAKKNELKYLSICDSEMFGAMEFYKKCTNNNIKPILGLEISINKSKIFLLAKNYDGYKNLIKLSTKNSEGSTTFDDLYNHSGSCYVFISINDLNIYNELKDKIEDIYLTISNNNEINIASQYTSKIVYSNEVRCLTAKDTSYLKYLYMIRDGKTVNNFVDIDTSDNYFTFKSLPDSIRINMDEIASTCKIEFPSNGNLLPIYDVDNPYEYLKYLSMKGLKRRLNDIVDDKYLKRLNYELDVINKMGFCNYFLVVYDFIKYAKMNKILVGPGRGSAAGSLVSFSLGITDIDPVKYDLLFERFLNPERHTMPDIDTDFPDIYRDDVINYVKNKYGERRVAGIVTFGTLAPRLVLRDVGRVLEISNQQIELITKKIPNVTKLHLIDFYNNDSDIKNMVDNDNRLKLLYKISTIIEGLPRHTSSHAAGIIMSRVDLDTVIPLTKNIDMYLSGYTMEYLEELGLLKMDFLGLKNLTTIMNIIEDIKTNEGINIDFNRIPLDDKAALLLFQKADTTGIFQFESQGMKNFLSKLHPNSFEDIFAAIALFRPGPSNNIDSFIRRKEGREKVTYLDPSLEGILKNTYGIIIYQEQIMQVAEVFAGYTLGEADILRRAMSKKKYDVLKNEQEKFINKSIALGHSRELAEEVYSLILQFANYGFNRSHSVAYSIIAYKMAYLKAKFPKYFYANLLSSVIGVDTKTREYINEIKGKNIKILKPDINLSSDKYNVCSEGIIYPLSNIKNVGVVVCNEILNNRGSGYDTIFDFFKRSSSRVINKKVIESLIDASCFDRFLYNHQTLHNNLDEILNYSNLIKEIDEEFVLEPEIVIYEEYSKEELIKKEKEVFGFYLSNHPVTSYKVRDNININLNEISKYFNQNITVIGLIDKIKKIVTKNNQEMAFISISDEYTSIDLTLFPNLFSENFALKVGDIIKVNGNVERRYDSYQMIGRKIEKL